MTGYGSAALDRSDLRATVTVRSVNHRFLELSLHLSRRVQPLEAELKRLVQGRVQRGKVEVSLQAAIGGSAAGVRVVPQPLLAEIVRTLREVKAEHGLAGEVSVSDVVRFPGALEVVDDAGALDASVREALCGLVERALAGLDAMRRAEGAHLEADLLGCLAAIEDAATRVATLTEEGKAQRRQALAERVRALGQEAGLDDARLYPEVVRLVERHDVAEEVQRLRSHVAQARVAIGSGEPCGKRLDFLAQELAREANTIGSKAASAALVQEVVGLKSGVERLREQVQNAE
jgi:uncharacterized protein (TIGR00255 family)